MNKEQRKAIADKIKVVVDDLTEAVVNDELDRDVVSEWQDSLNGVIDDLNDGEGEL